MDVRSAPFSVRLINIDHRLVERGKLDRKYCQFHAPGVPFQRVPVIRIFGSTEAGQRVCVHVHQVFPYLYVPYFGDLDPASVQTYIQQLGTSLNHAVGRVLKRNPVDPTHSQFVAAVVLVKGIPFYGYHVGWEHFLKIYLVDPATRYAVVQVLQQGGVMGRQLQPHEAHIPFEMQFMIDHNLYGMGMVHISDLLFRVPFHDKPPGRVYTAGRPIYTEPAVPEKYLWPEHCAPARESHCELECDILASNTMNRYLVKERNLHHDWSEAFRPRPPDKLVTSLAALWEEEECRMRALNKPPPSTQTHIDPSRPPPGAPPSPWSAEERLRKILEILVLEDAPNAADIAAKFGFPIEGNSVQERHAERHHNSSMKPSADEPQILTAFQATSALYPMSVTANWQPALSQSEARGPEEGEGANEAFEDGTPPRSQDSAAGSTTSFSGASHPPSFTMVLNEQAIEVTQRAIELENPPYGLTDKSSDEDEHFEADMEAPRVIHPEDRTAVWAENCQPAAKLAEGCPPTRMNVTCSYSEDVAFLRDHAAELSPYVPTPSQRNTQPNNVSSQEPVEGHQSDPFLVSIPSSIPSSPITTQRQEAYNPQCGSRVTPHPARFAEPQFTMQMYRCAEQQGQEMGQSMCDAPSDDLRTPFLETNILDFPSSPVERTPEHGSADSTLAAVEAKRKRPVRIPQYDGADDDDELAGPPAIPFRLRRKRSLAFLSTSSAGAKCFEGGLVAAGLTHIRSTSVPDEEPRLHISKVDEDRRVRRSFGEPEVEVTDASAACNYSSSRGLRSSIRRKGDLRPLGMRLRSGRLTAAGFGQHSRQSEDVTQPPDVMPANSSSVRAVKDGSKEQAQRYHCDVGRPEDGRMSPILEKPNPHSCKSGVKSKKRRVAFVEVEVQPRNCSDQPSKVISASSQRSTSKIASVEEKTPGNQNSLEMTWAKTCGPLILVPSSPPPFSPSGRSNSGCTSVENGYALPGSPNKSSLLRRGETISGRSDASPGSLPGVFEDPDRFCDSYRTKRPESGQYSEKAFTEEAVLVPSSQAVLLKAAVEPAPRQQGKGDGLIGESIHRTSENCSSPPAALDLTARVRSRSQLDANSFQLDDARHASVSKVPSSGKVGNESGLSAVLSELVNMAPSSREVFKPHCQPFLEVRSDRGSRRSAMFPPPTTANTHGYAKSRCTLGVGAVGTKSPRLQQSPGMRDHDEVLPESCLIDDSFPAGAATSPRRKCCGSSTPTYRQGGVEASPLEKDFVVRKFQNEQSVTCGTSSHASASPEGSSTVHGTTTPGALVVWRRQREFPSSMDSSLLRRFAIDNQGVGNVDLGHFDSTPPFPASSSLISGKGLSHTTGDETERDPNACSSSGQQPGVGFPRERDTDNCLNEGSDRIFRYHRLPPTFEELSATFQSYGIPPVLYREPYYSDPRDVPFLPKEYAGKVFNVVSDTIAHLPEFCDEDYVRKVREVENGIPLQEFRPEGMRNFLAWRKAFMGLQSEAPFSSLWTRCAPPPPRAEVVRWLDQARSLENEGLNDYIDEVDAATVVEENWKSAIKKVSQLEGPTPPNTYGFKFSQSTKNAVSVEKQHLGVLSLEIFVCTRGSLQPNPDDDPLRALFVCWLSEVEDECSNGDRPGYRVIIITTESARLPSTGISGFEIEICHDENEMLHALISRVRHLDPDILTGYEIHNSSWGYVIQRASFVYGINLVEQLSRVSLPANVRTGREGNSWGYHRASAVHITGRHMLNIWRLMRSEVNLTSYTYENVVFHVLHERVPKFSHRTLTTWFQHGSPIMRWKVFTYMIERVQGNMKILEDTEVITRTCEFARIFGVDFYAVISRGSQFKVESLMFRLAKPENFILISPSKVQVKEQRALECLALVMEPESAFYSSPVCVLDFQSLYPSVVIAYNYCYSTCLGRLVEGPGRKKLGVREDFDLQPGVLALLKDYLNISPNGLVFVKETIRKSLLAKMLEELLHTRVMIKNAMKEHEHDKALLKILNARQLSLKYIANVTYGYTSASFSGRMPCAEIADAIVQTGRETNEKAITFVNAHSTWGARVRYGDTDSMFAHLYGQARSRAFEVGRAIAATITSLNPPPVTLKFEKVYHPCVLLAKKRYVGNMFEYGHDEKPKFEAKGIEVIRRDGCPAVQKLQEASLKILFRTQNLSEIKAYMQRQFEKILQGRVSLQDFLFAKEIKDLANYTNLPPGAVVCLKKMAEDPRSEPQYKERIPYLIAHGSPNDRLCDLAVSPEEFLSNRHMRLNGLYYINKAIIPPLARIFNLVGADVQSWFEKMPRTYRATRYIMNEEGGVPGRRTIDHFYHSCLVCRELTSNVLCPSCELQPQETFLTMAQAVSKQEKRLGALLDVCSACSALPRLPDVPCVSLDCPVYFERAKARNLTQLAMEEEERALGAI